MESQFTVLRQARYEHQHQASMVIQRVNGKTGYGVKTTIRRDNVPIQVGEGYVHTDFTLKHPEVVERYLDRMEKDLRLELEKQ